MRCDGSSSSADEIGTRPGSANLSAEGGNRRRCRPPATCGEKARRAGGMGPGEKVLCAQRAPPLSCLVSLLLWAQHDCFVSHSDCRVIMNNEQRERCTAWCPWRRLPATSCGEQCSPVLSRPAVGWFLGEVDALDSHEQGRSDLRKSQIAAAPTRSVFLTKRKDTVTLKEEQGEVLPVEGGQDVEQRLTCREIEQRERFTRSNHSRRFESIAFRMFGEIGEIVVVDVLGYDFPGRLCSMTLMAPKVVGATCLTKFRPIARLCAMRTVLLRLAQVAPSTELRKCADCVCAEDTCRCWFVSAVESGRIVSRVAERNCGGTAGREESVRPCGPSSGLQGNEAARCELVLDGFDCCNLEWKLYESAKGDGLVEQSSDESRTHRSLRSSLQ